jgi:hypothetical protein
LRPPLALFFHVSLSKESTLRYQNWIVELPLTHDPSRFDAECRILPVRHIVFISHAAEDAPSALFFCDALEKNGITCWIAPRDVPRGVEYAEVIVEATETSKVLLVLLSLSANASRYVMREVSLALDSGISIMPTLAALRTQ